MKRTAPSLSIITLTRNRAALLERNLSSIARQMTGRDEIIVIDNGSTDRTRNVLAAFASRMPLRAFTIKKGKYPTLYNTGIRKAKKEIVVFYDDDCIAHPRFLSRIRMAHRNRPNAVIQGMTYSIPKGNIFADIMGDHYVSFLESNSLGKNRLRVLDNKNASVARSTLLRYGGFCEKLECGSEDIELGIRLRSHGIPIVLDRSIICSHHERTTLRTFVDQHLRFAACEGTLDTILPDAEKTGLVRWRKLRIQIALALKREMTYIRTGNIGHAVALPLLYILLATLRIWGYARHR